MLAENLQAISQNKLRYVTLHKYKQNPAKVSISLSKTVVMKKISRA